MKNKRIRLPVRYFTIDRMYGPGMAHTGVEGYHTRDLMKPMGQTGLVLVHCWNVGEMEGPYPMDNHRVSGCAADWVPRAQGIMEDRIKPLLDTAREAGLTVFHLAQAAYADKYPQYRELAADPAMQDPCARTEASRCVRPRNAEEIWHDEYGPGYPGPVWQTHAGTFDIARSLRPVPTEDLGSTAGN